MLIVLNIYSFKNIFTQMFFFITNMFYLCTNEKQNANLKQLTKMKAIKDFWQIVIIGNYRRFKKGLDPVQSDRYIYDEWDIEDNTRNYHNEKPMYMEKEYWTLKIWY